MVQVGGHIKRLREARGWSQPRLAVEAGVAVSAVSQIENGRRSPNVSTLDKLAEAFGVEVADFFPKARSSSLEPPLFDGLEDERRAELAAIRESYRETREGLDSYCDAWERRVAAGDLDRLAVQGFLEAGDPLLPAMTDAVVSELIEISRVVGATEDGRVSKEMLAEASLKPVVDRYHTIGRKLQVMWRERFAETQPAEATEDNKVADFLAYKDAKLQAAVSKRAASG